jgi:hypothetical protein
LSKRLIAMLFGVLAMAAIAAGCGDSGGSSLTKAEYIKRGDEICKKGNEGNENEFEAFAKEKGLKQNEAPTEAQKEELVTDVVLPSISKQAEELGDLGTPETEGEQAEAIVESLDEAIEKAEAEPARVLGGQGPFEGVDKMAAEYGFRVCGQG